MTTFSHSLGRAASVHSANSSLGSGHWNSAARKRPFGSAYSRPTPVRRPSPKRSDGRIQVLRTRAP
ncbi:hypothetical protein C0Z18_32040 [Trinickia dabaoshanensis]|uniref:Uncharacterized protein n=1 Tax=Trinickia dabaoshanensis TaxID=564714 RepID=A0A2N7VBA5_9BURK|nr:hypothetical protein C0Z18_32040 [Trinickia dabaoshanensis]